MVDSSVGGKIAHAAVSRAVSEVAGTTVGMFTKIYVEAGTPPEVRKRMGYGDPDESPKPSGSSS